MRLRFLFFLFLLAPACGSAAAAVPTPREHFGFEPGDDYKLADYSQITSYFEKLSHASDRLRWVEFGRTSLGKPMFAAFISSPENLARLDDFRIISRRLALGRLSPAEARSLAAKGRAIVWIDSGLHASEVAPSQQAPALAFRLLTEETPEVAEIRRRVILVQIPCINPDGLDMVVDWYRSNLGSRYELAPLPWLYQKYAGHDNNRDWYMLNLPETRHVTRLLFDQWFPQIVYNQHQAPPFPARIFIPPYAEPLNPNIPASVMEGINEIGSAIKDRLALEDLPGALSYQAFDAWWDGGLRSVPAFHNMHGILTETAGDRYASPADIRDADLADHFENGIPTREPTVFYERPWRGGRWTLRDAIRYMLAADMAILHLAAVRSQDYLYKAYASASAQIALGQAAAPFAYIVPERQWDPTAAREMLLRLQLAGIEIQRLTAPLQYKGNALPAGSYLLLASQPFRGYLLDLMDPLQYPQLRGAGDGLIRRPYDIAGWTLPLQMGVEVTRIDEPVALHSEPVPALPPPEPPSSDHRDASFFSQLAALLARGSALRWDANGQLLVSGDAPTAAFDAAPYRLRLPRVGVYTSWVPNIDAGWTDWLLDQAHLPHSLLHNADVQKTALHDRWDAIILPAQSAESILHGWRAGERAGREASPPPSPLQQQRPEYTGGLEIAGLATLEQFVRAGGWLLAFDQAGELPIAHFPLPVRQLLRPASGATVSTTTYYCPGSILRATFDTASPLAFGMPPDAYVFSSGGQAYESALLPEYNQADRALRVVGRYALSAVLASGFLSGEKSVAGKPLLLDVRYGQGHVILFGFRPQFRGQTFGTFRLVLNALYLSAAQAAPLSN